MKSVFIFICSVQSERRKDKTIVISSLFGGKSHAKYLLETSLILKQRGYKIKYFSMKSFAEWASNFEIEAESILDDFLLKEQESIIKYMSKKEGKVSEFRSLMDFITSDYEILFRNLESLAFKNSLPDLVICDHFAIYCSDVAKKYNLPLIIGFQTIDNPTIGYLPYVSEQLNSIEYGLEDRWLYERLKKRIHKYIWGQYLYNKFEKKLNDMRRNVGAKPLYGNILADWNSCLKIANTFLGFETPRPLPSSLKIIGPILSPKTYKIDEKFSKFMNIHKKVLYIAFGTNVVLLRNNVKLIVQTIFKALDSKKIDGVIWTFSKAEISRLPKRIELDNRKIKLNAILNNENPDILVTDRSPQVEILNHNNTFLFWSHGGLESCFESLESGKPVLVMSFFGDQHLNGLKLERIGNGKSIDRKTATPEQIMEHIDFFIENKDGARLRRIGLFKEIIKGTNKRKAEAADLIEGYLARSIICGGSSNLDNDCLMTEYDGIDQRIGFIKYNLLDVDIFLFILAFLIVLFTMKLSSFIYTKYFDNKIKQKSE